MQLIARSQYANSWYTRERNVFLLTPLQGRQIYPFRKGVTPLPESYFGRLSSRQKFWGGRASPGRSQQSGNLCDIGKKILIKLWWKCDQNSMKMRSNLLSRPNIPQYCRPRRTWNMCLPYIWVAYYDVHSLHTIFNWPWCEFFCWVTPENVWPAHPPPRSRLQPP